MIQKYLSSENCFFVLLTDLAYCLRNIGTEWFWLTGIRSHGQMRTQDTDIKCYTNSCIPPGKFSFVRKSIMTVSSPNHIMCVWCHHLNHVICVWLVQTIASPEQINLSKNPTIGRVMNMIGGSRMNLHCIDLLIRHFGQATKRRQSVFLLYLCIMTHISAWFIFIWLRRQLILFLLPDANHIQMHLIRL